MYIYGSVKMGKQLKKSVYSRWLALALVMMVILTQTSIFVFANNTDADIDGEVQLNESATVFSVSESEDYVDSVLTQMENTSVFPDKVSATSAGEDVSTWNDATMQSYGTYPRRYGVILVTADKYKGLIPTGHAAIVWSYDRVVESLPQGVTTGNNDWYKSKITCFGITAYGTTASQDSAASNWCYSQKGKPYNYNYFNTGTRKSFYCSQLVWAAYKDLYGINMNTPAFVTTLGNPVHPLELVASPATYIVYQK